MAVPEQVEREIVVRRDQLVSRRTHLLHQRANIISELRQVDRELTDCAAAARFFGLAIDFPPDEREEYERIRAEQRERELREREVMRARAARAVAEQTALRLDQPQGSISTNEPVALVAPLQVVEQPRPTVREIALKMLQGTGSSGMKAEVIRDFLDRHHGLSVHDKTVGMTLYRLSKERLVHRVGHTWFAGPSPMGTENPGAETPGPINEVNEGRRT